MSLVFAFVVVALSTAMSVPVMLYGLGELSKECQSVFQAWALFGAAAVRQLSCKAQARPCALLMFSPPRLSQL